MKKEGLWAHSLQLQFTPQQLEQLNVYFSDLESNQELKSNGSLQWIEGEIDKLIQYLCHVIGILDPRFSSEFLIRLESSKNGKNGNSFSYLVRLDSLSSQPPPSSFNHEIADISLEFNKDKILDGFSLIKLEGENAKHWQAYTNEDGYLKRDAIQKKYIELLEEATVPKIDNVQNVIRKVNSHISPGKIVDAETFYYIQTIPSDERVFYGYAEDGKKSDTTDVRKFRVEIIESNNLIRMRIGFLSPNTVLDEDIDVVLILGIGLQGWPSSADYPERILFTNCDILLHYQISASGFFLITANPSISLDNKNCSLMWQFFFPSADCMLMNHYSNLSCVIRTFNVIYAVILNLRRTTPGGQTIGKYLLKNLLWFQLEILNDPKLWTSDYLSFHVISILDKLVKALRSHKCRSYFFKDHNALTNSFRNSLSQFTNKDYKEDADIIETFINRIYALSSSELIGHQSVSGENLRNRTLIHESMLMKKWNNILLSMAYNRKKQNGTFGFISKQLEYIVFLYRIVSLTKSLTIPSKNHCVNSLYSTVDLCNRILSRRMDYEITMNLDDILYVLRLILDQAKKLYIMINSTKSYNDDHLLNFCSNISESDRNLLSRYDEEVSVQLERCIIDSAIIFNDDIQAIKLSLNILFQNLTNSKIIRKILKPYLKLFFQSTHENCWHLEEWKNRIFNEELVSLKIFSKLISRKKVKFKIALLDAFQKGWDWAYELIKLGVTMKAGQDLLFSSNGQITRRYLIFSDDEIKQLRGKLQRTATIFKNDYPSTIMELSGTLRLDEKFNENWMDENNEIPLNIKLCECSPMTRLINRNRRRGINIGIGSTTMAMVVLGKFTTLQEITETLPEEKRRRALEIIRRAVKEKQRFDRLRAKQQDREEIYRSLPEYYYLNLNNNYEDVQNIGKPEDKNIDSISYYNYGHYCPVLDDGSHSSGFVSFDTCSASSLGLKFGSKNMSTETVVLHNSDIYYEPLTFHKNIGSLSWKRAFKKTL